MSAGCPPPFFSSESYSMSHTELLWEDGEDRKTLTARGLRLVFARSGDRWTHRLEVAESGLAIAAPIEVDAEKADPTSIVSPVYQEIHVHEFGEDSATPRCILLTGRLFDHQFSAAVTFSLDPTHTHVVDVDWDVADRCRTTVAHFAATYQSPLVSGDLADAGPNSIRWASPSLGAGMLEFHAGPPESVALAEAGRNGTRFQAVAKLIPGDFTHRLRYRWKWAAAAGSLED